MDSIYDALKAGQSIDEITDRISEEINAALQKIEAERAADEALKNKNQDAHFIATSLNQYIEKYYPDLNFEVMPKDIDIICEYFNICAGIINGFKNSIDDPIIQFFEENGI